MTPVRKKVLVVEDDPAIRTLVSKNLSTLNVDVTEVGDARSALSSATLSTPDLVCLDLVLPDTSGLALYEQMQEDPVLKHVPVMVLTARASLLDRAEAQDRGINIYLTKPFRRAEFLKVARGLLDSTH